MAFLIWLADRMSTCQQMSGSHIYKLQRSTISCNAAYLICVHSKKYLLLVFMAKICFFFLGFSPLIPYCWPFPQALCCGTSKKYRKSNNWIHFVHFSAFFNKFIGLYFVASKNLKTFGFTNGWSSWSQCKYRDQKVGTVNHNYKVS